MLSMPNEEDNYVRVHCEDPFDHDAAENAWGVDHGPVSGGKRIEIRSVLTFSLDSTFENCPKVGDHIIAEDRGYLFFDVRSGTVLERANELW